MKHFGDITKLNGTELPVVDIITGGSPCQDLSVAGKRAGLAGERSGLFMEQIRIIKEMREHDRADRRTNEHIRPRYMVWENVPGAFSSNNGEDFRAVLEETAKVTDKDAVIPRPENGKWSYSGCIMGDGWSIAWRTHDAQFWGVPQRRRRICLVADFDGDTAGKILFDVQLRGEAEYAEAFKIVSDIGEESQSEVQPFRESVSRNIEQSEQERKGTACDTERSIGASSYTLKIRGGVEVDSAGKKAGKGPLVQTELSATLGVSQDQTLITGVDDYYSNEEKQQIEDFVKAVNKDAKHQQDLIQSDLGVARALAPGTHAAGSHLTKTLVTGCLTPWDAQSKRVFDSESVCGTLNSGAAESGNIIPSVCLNPWDVQSKHIQTEQGIAEALYSGECRYGGGESYVLQEPQGINGDIAGTLDASYYKGCGERQGTERDVVCFGISAFESNSMKSSNPHSGIYEADTTRTLDNNGGNPACNQGGMIVLEGNGSRDSHKGDGYNESETMYTLNTVEQHAVCVGNGQYNNTRLQENVGTLNCMHDQQAILTYGLDRASFNQGQNAKFDFSVDEELSPPIVARGPGGVLTKQ